MDKNSNINKLFTEERLSTIFSFLILFFLIFGIIAFFQNKTKNPQITQEAAQTQATLAQEGPYEPVQVYWIKPGDSLSSIAKDLYGDIIYWPLLQMENGIDNVNLIYSGDFLNLPSKEALQDFSSKVKPGQILTGVSIEALTDKVYKVVKGDTLWYICERRYGDSRKYTDIAKINKIINPNHIEVDWQLSLPDL